MGSIDLQPFVEAWNSGDVEAIRSFYTEDAAYLSDEQAMALQRRMPESVLIADEAFADRVREVTAQRLRMLGDPVQIFDRLIGFAFRWEGATEGHNGVALLRYEGGAIWLHTYAMSTAVTANPPGSSAALEQARLDGLMEAWSSGDVVAVQALCSA